MQYQTIDGIPHYGAKADVVIADEVQAAQKERELAEHMFRQHMEEQVRKAVAQSMNEAEASRMNVAGVTLSQYRRKQLLSGASALLHMSGDNERAFAA